VVVRLPLVDQFILPVKFCSRAQPRATCNQTTGREVQANPASLGRGSVPVLNWSVEKINYRAQLACCALNCILVQSCHLCYPVQVPCRRHHCRLQVFWRKMSA